MNNIFYCLIFQYRFLVCY